MRCEVRPFPVTDFLSDHPFGVMNEISSPQRRREETFPVRSTLPSREPSRADLELAQHLVGHSQGITSNRPSPNEQVIDSPSPSQELRHPETTLITAQEAPSPDSLEREERESSQSYAPVVSQPGSVPSGQVCRYICCVFR
jgi:GATA-binding protein